MFCLITLQSKNALSTTLKRDKSPPKNRSLLVHIVELYTAVVEVDTKVYLC